LHLLKIRAKSLKICAKSLNILEKRRATLFDFIKWRPTFADKHTKTFFGGHPKKVFMIFEGKNCRQSRPKLFGQVWENSGKILRSPKNLPAPTPMVLSMQLPQQSICESKHNFHTQLSRTNVNENSSMKVQTIHMKTKWFQPRIQS